MRKIIDKLTYNLAKRYLPVVDRPTYQLGWNDGHVVGLREGYERAVQELGRLDAEQIVSIYRQHQRRKT